MGPNNLLPTLCLRQGSPVQGTEVLVPCSHSHMGAPIQRPLCSRPPWLCGWLTAAPYSCPSLHLSIFKKESIYLSLERGNGREKERERNINVWLSLVHPPTGNLAHTPDMCPDWESNQRPFGLHAGAQSTEPHQLGLFF